MSRTCDICGKGPAKGRKYARRGLAKKKGGVGRKVTGKANRTFRPNLQKVKVRESNGTVRTRTVCASCLRTGLRKGTIRKAIGRMAPAKTEDQPAIAEA